MRQTAAIVLLLCASGAIAQTAKPEAKRPSSVTKKAAQAAPKRPATPKAAAKRSGRSKSVAKKRVVARSRVQQAPTPARYAEIQQALVDKGYFAGAADGVWGADSIAALKHFQEDQKLEATGKITALSLIRLGLGPKREQPAQNGGLVPLPPKVEP